MSLSLEWIQKLMRDGYVVCEGVLSGDECDVVRNSIDSYTAACGFPINSPTVSPNDYPNTKQILNHAEISHLQEIWEVRMNAAVRQHWIEMCGTTDLLCSTDRVRVMQPWHGDIGSEGLHMDQTDDNEGLLCVQGLINLTDSSTPSTGSLLVLPGSHLKTKEFMAAFPEAAEKRGNWCPRFSPAQTEFFGVEPVRVHGGKGSLVLWFSNTVHRGIAASSAPEWQPTLPRYVMYVSYQPRLLATRADLDKKADAFRNHTATSHWASQFVKKFPAWSYSRNKQRNEALKAQRAIFERNKPPSNRVESQLMLELVGIQRPLNVTNTQPLIPFASNAALAAAIATPPITNFFPVRNKRKTPPPPSLPYPEEEDDQPRAEAVA